MQGMRPKIFEQDFFPHKICFICCLSKTPTRDTGLCKPYRGKKILCLCYYIRITSPQRVKLKHRPMLEKSRKIRGVNVSRLQLDQGGRKFINLAKRRSVLTLNIQTYNSCIKEYLNHQKINHALLFSFPPLKKRIKNLNLQCFFPPLHLIILLIYIVVKHQTWSGRNEQPLAHSSRQQAKGVLGH